jgi:hypothetical protein
MTRSHRFLCLAAVAGVWGTSATFAQPNQALDPIPVEGFQQLMPRGAIGALVDPDFVPAASAKIPDDAWVLGFAHGGKAYAYDLNLLNSHEVVNHEAGGALIAAVW